MITSWDLEFFGHVLTAFVCLLLGFYVTRVETGGPPVGLFPQTIYDSGHIDLQPETWSFFSPPLTILLRERRNTTI